MLKNRIVLFYAAALFVWICVSWKPLFECAILFQNIFAGYIVSDFANENLIIPFAAIMISLFAGFVFFSVKKIRIAAFIISAAVFLFSNIFFENAASKQWRLINSLDVATGELMHLYPELTFTVSDGEIAYLIEESELPFGENNLFLINGQYFMSRSVQHTRSGAVIYYLEDGREVVSSRRFNIFFEAENPLFPSAEEEISSEPIMHVNLDISPAVKLHYYIFSIILILAMLNFLFILIHNFSLSRLLVHAITGAAYLSSVLAVRVIDYVHFESSHITPESTVSVLLCIILAAVSAGLLIEKSHVLASAVSACTVILLYFSEFLMLGGSFYKYGNSFIFAPIPFLMFSAANVLVVLLTPTIVCFLSKLRFAK
ncbi:MAG: hypothetical protein LBI27_00500 [Clostridiales bacterium]|jgi:hypothetical protein|nr:hypothetical protein [Clostridiales bacterium]